MMQVFSPAIHVQSKVKSKDMIIDEQCEYIYICTSIDIHKVQSPPPPVMNNNNTSTNTSTMNRGHGMNNTNNNSSTAQLPVRPMGLRTFNNNTNNNINNNNTNNINNNNNNTNNITNSDNQGGECPYIHNF